MLWRALRRVGASGLFLALSVMRAAADPCGLADSRDLIIRDIDARLDLVAEDGTHLQMPGVEPPSATPDHPDWPQSVVTALRGWLVGRAARAVPLRATPDRWGRLPVRLYALAPQAAEAGLLSVEASMFGAGLARLLPVPEARACRTEWLAQEASAREARLGLWADPYYSVLTSGDGAAISGREGRTILFEGTVASIGETAARTYLNFGPRRGVDISVTILKQNRVAFERAGLRVQAFQGQKLRIRGTLDLRFGPQIEITSPDQIETAGPSVQDAAEIGRK